MSESGITVRKNEAAHRFEAQQDGRLAILTYQQRDGRITLIHTEVPTELEGHGIGAALARAALEDARAEGLRVVPLCPFVRGYIERHPEYETLVAAGDERGPAGAR
ncbi:MAG TPA: GNAT family N-acetyltransferase [Dehalococcoidia bacterium]|jgi:predicted GNAT family acetyltransferase|nr:GNAT family N-acetyltransferase [Dehalococcoidia bacterium]